MLEHLALSSLPNILTIFVAVGLFCTLYPLRPHVGRNTVLAMLACLALSCISALIHYTLVPWIDGVAGDFVSRVPTLLFFVMVLLSCVPVSRLVFEMGVWDALFCCTAGYALQNFAHVIWEVASVAALPDELPQAAAAALQIGLSAVLYVLCYLTVIRRIRTNHLEGGGNWRTIFVLASVIAVNIVLDVTLRSIQTTGSVALEPFVVLRGCQLLVCALTLVLDYEILYSNRMRAAAATARQMMDDERRQYELSQETIEAINLRCHDIRHQVRQLTGPGAGSQAFMENISDLISVYDAGIHTSNHALDVILTEKSILCQNKGIELTCTADGRLLSFMEEQDVYSVFGNALDNAIEAVEGVSDPTRRIIDVSTRQAGRMVSIQVRNFYEGNLSFKDGLPQTTHQNGLHGYGMKSLRLAAERYGGTLTPDAQDGMFRLLMLLPLPE